MTYERGLVCAVVLVLAACGSKAKTDAPSDSAADKKPAKSSSATASKASAAASAKNGHSTKGQLPPDPSFTIGAASCVQGSPVELTFNAALTPPEGQQYWVTIVKAGAPDADFGHWHYVKTGADKDEIKAPEAGDYEVRLHDLYPKFPFKVIKREKLTITCEGGSCEPAPAPPPPPEKPKAASDGYLPDGWPAEIPPRGLCEGASTSEDWDGVKREVPVWQPAQLHSETKIVREWLRVSCHPNDFGNPNGVTEERSDGQQSFKFADGQNLASLVVELVEGKSYTATFTWDTGAFELLQRGRPEAVPKRISSSPASDENARRGGRSRVVGRRAPGLQAPSFLDLTC